MTQQKIDDLDRKDPLLGMQLGDYIIRTLIGRGGMARVYEGVDEKLDRRAAIKVMRIQHDAEDEMTARFIREARAVASLDHPNIISIYQFGEGPDLYYMAMKYIEGRTLLSILKQMRVNESNLDPAQTVTIIADVAAALDYAHSRGVIHRDIKPSNIMLTPEGRAVLTDFGLTMQVGSDTLGTAFGTPRYIAPEQAISSQRSVPQSDIYSLGVVLYEMVTGQAPFDSDSPMGLAISHITMPPPPPQTVRPDLPHPVQMVILKALEKRPENRWQTAAVMADALRAAYQGIEPDVVLTHQNIDVPLSSAIMGIASPGLSNVELTAMVPAASRPPKRPRRLPRSVLSLLAFIVFGIVLLAFNKLNPNPGLVGTLSAEKLNQIDQFPTPAPRIRLIYSKNMFAIYNATGQTVSLEGVTFARNDLSSPPFAASIFGDRTHKALAAGQCLRLKMRGADDQFWPQICGPQTSARILDDPNAVFWAMRADKDQTTTFVVNRGGKTIQTCSMRLNTCEFSLP